MIDTSGSGDAPAGGDTGLLSPETILENIAAETHDVAMFPGTMREVWFFAYDLLLEQATISRFIKKMSLGRVVSLPNFRLEFPYYCPPLGTSLPTPRRTNNQADAVWGFIYDAREKDFAALESFLKVPNRYHRSAISVQDRGGRRIPAFTYVLTLQDDVPRPPTQNYRDQMLAAATMRNLPAEWLATLAAWEVEQEMQSGGAV